MAVFVSAPLAMLRLEHRYMLNQVDDRHHGKMFELEDPGTIFNDLLLRRGQCYYTQLGTVFAQFITPDCDVFDFSSHYYWDSLIKMLAPFCIQVRADGSTFPFMGYLRSGTRFSPQAIVATRNNIMQTACQFQVGKSFPGGAYAHQMGNYSSKYPFTPEDNQDGFIYPSWEANYRDLLVFCYHYFSLVLKSSRYFLKSFILGLLPYIFNYTFLKYCLTITLLYATVTILLKLLVESILSKQVGFFGCDLKLPKSQTYLRSLMEQWGNAIYIPNAITVKDPYDETVIYKAKSDGFYTVDGDYHYSYDTSISPGALLYTDAYFDIYECGTLTVKDLMIRTTLSNYYIINPFTWLSLMSTLIQYYLLNNHDDYSVKDGYGVEYPLIESGLKVYMHQNNKLLLVRDYDTHITHHISINQFSKVMVQSRSSYETEKVETRIKSQIAVVENLEKVVFDPKHSLAIIAAASYVHRLIIDCNLGADLKSRQYKLIMPLFRVTKKTLEQRFKKQCLRGDYKPQKEGSTCTITNDYCLTGDKYWYKYSPCASHHIVYPKPCVCNAAKAIKNRQLADMGKYNPFQAAKFIKWARKNISKFIDFETVMKYSRQDWLLSLPNGKQKKKLLGQQANEKSGIINSKSCEVQGFMKAEPYNRKQRRTDDDYIEDTIDPRLVSGRHECYDVIGGPRIKAISKTLAKYWSFISEFATAINGITYFSTGLNKVSVGKWMDKQLKKNNPIFYNTDYARFDASTHQYLMMLEIDIYSMIFPDDVEFHNWLKIQLETSGTVHIRDEKDRDMVHKVKYFCYGTRKSGDQNTSVGNTIINMLIQLYAMSLQYPNIEQLVRNGTVDYIVLGDDTGICTDGLYIDEKKYVKDIRRLGLTIALQRKTQHTLTFCSSYFVPAIYQGEETHVLTQKLGRNISRAYTSANKQDNIEGWIKTNAYAYAKDYSHIPFMRSWHASKYFKYAKSKAIQTDEHFFHKHISETIGPSVRLYDFMAAVYNISDDEYNNYVINDKFDDITTEKIIDVDVYGKENFYQKPYEIPAEELDDVLGYTGHITFEKIPQVLTDADTFHDAGAYSYSNIYINDNTITYELDVNPGVIIQFDDINEVGINPTFKGTNLNEDNDTDLPIEGPLTLKEYRIIHFYNASGRDYESDVYYTNISDEDMSDGDHSIKIQNDIDVVDDMELPDILFDEEKQIFILDVKPVLQDLTVNMPSIQPEVQTCSVSKVSGGMESRLPSSMTGLIYYKINADCRYNFSNKIINDIKLLEVERDHLQIRNDTQKTNIKYPYGIHVYWKNYSKKYFGHPIARGERLLCMTLLFNKFHYDALPVFDIGTRMHRNRQVIANNKFEITISGSQPGKCAKDRNMAKFANVSDFTAWQVATNEVIKEPTNLLMIDVIYYIPYRDIIALLSNPNVKALYSIHARFVSRAGNLNNEVTWVGDKETNMCSFTIKDTKDHKTPSVTKFQHGCLEDWYNHTSICTETGMFIAWQCIYRCSTYDIFVIRRC